VFEYAAVPHPLLTVVTQRHPTPWAEMVGDHLGLGLVTASSSMADAALGKLEKTVDDGMAPGIVAARGALPWGRLGSAGSPSRCGA
jgi:hypothetical protein